jgi:hypothetical protein
MYRDILTRGSIKEQVRQQFIIIIISYNNCIYIQSAAIYCE